MDLLLYNRKKGNTRIMSRARKKKARILIKDECTHVCTNIKFPERIELKEKIQFIFPKREEIKAILDGNILQESMPETTNYIWTCVYVSMFNFGNETGIISYYDEDEDMRDEDFLN